MLYNSRKWCLGLRVHVPPACEIVDDSSLEGYINARKCFAEHAVDKTWAVKRFSVIYQFAERCALQVPKNASAALFLEYDGMALSRINNFHLAISQRDYVIFRTKAKGQPS